MRHHMNIKLSRHALNRVLFACKEIDGKEYAKIFTEKERERASAREREKEGGMEREAESKLTQAEAGRAREGVRQCSYTRQCC